MTQMLTNARWSPRYNATSVTLDVGDLNVHAETLRNSGALMFALAGKHSNIVQSQSNRCSGRMASIRPLRWAKIRLCR